LVDQSTLFMESHRWQRDRILCSHFSSEI
jgi:hypothetical protein